MAHALWIMHLNQLTPLPRRIFSSLLAQSNPFNGNGHRDSTLIQDHPELPKWIQDEIDDKTPQKRIPERLSEKHHVSVSLRSVERIIKEHNLKTVRRPGLTQLEQTSAILTLAEEDPLSRWGARKYKEKLENRGVLVPRDFVSGVLATANPEANEQRRPGAEKVHKKGLHSSGPDEEWCFDGHEKISGPMGISVYGINDKFSRLEQLLKALRSARKSSVPPALYLKLLIVDFVGIPIQSTTDMGSETHILAALQSSLRQSASPLDLQKVPAHQSVKSVYNITRERAWRPLYHDELANVRWFYDNGKIEAGYHPLDAVHQDVSIFVWAKAVQFCLDRHMEEHNRHRIRKQKNSCLPTGGRPIDFYQRPHEFGGRKQLIPVDMAVVDRLIKEHTPDDLEQMASTTEMEEVCQLAFKAIGAPEVSARNGWDVFRAMIEYISSN
ncbi:hypothetical protein GGX14DRAFT_576656 [Mycena pura]|uniref:Integrase core domain-containing protein n=1 Tax=Mycena pura TaxID=153505 RepID=A0AAD6UTB0_9AGAR|nr:hypothetical protein GGX14DRAFT_576656 [Mycena pura]